MPYAPDTYHLTPEQITLKQETHRFAEEVLRPASMELDALSPDEVIAPGSRLRDVFKTAYQAEYHLRGFPEELGGGNLGPGDQYVVSEEMGWGSGGLAISLSVATMPFRFAAMRGHPDLMREVVMPFVEDREGKHIGCWAGTEPEHGSDTILPVGEHARPDVHLGCRAHKDGDEWVINGQKSAWVSNGTIATHALVYVCVDPALGMNGTGIALVPSNLPGVSKGKPLNKLGQRALNQGEIFFDDVRIPGHYMLIEPPAYSVLSNNIFAAANALMSATFAGVTRAGFEEALAYAQQRVQGGVPIAQHQLVQRKLFDMFMKVQAADAISRKANARLASGLPTHHYSMAAKVYCTQAAFEVASDAVQLHGGMGLAKGVLVEQLLRDARAALIEDGANDVLALSGARELLDEPGG